MNTAGSELPLGATQTVRPERATMRQCVTCHDWREDHDFITLTSTGREVKSCRACRLNSRRKHQKKKVRQSHIEKWVERLKHRIEIVCSQAALTPEVRKVIEQALLGCVECNRTI